MSSSEAPVRTIRFDEKVTMTLLVVPGRTMSSLEGRPPTPYPQPGRVHSYSGLVCTVSDHSDDGDDDEQEWGEGEETAEEGKDSSGSSDVEEHNEEDSQDSDMILEELMEGMLRDQNYHHCSSEAGNEYREGADFDSWIRTQQRHAGQFPEEHQCRYDGDGYNDAVDDCCMNRSDTDVYECGAMCSAHLNVMRVCSREPWVVDNGALGHWQTLEALEDGVLRSE